MSTPTSGFVILQIGKPIPKIVNGSMKMLQDYPWPGNVHELRHYIESTLISVEDNKLSFELPKIANSQHNVFKSFEEMERDYLLRVLKAKQWCIGGAMGAASALDIHVNTLHGKMKKLGIKKPSP